MEEIVNYNNLWLLQSILKNLNEETYSQEYQENNQRLTDYGTETYLQRHIVQAYVN